MRTVLWPAVMAAVMKSAGNTYRVEKPDMAGQQDAMATLKSASSTAIDRVQQLVRRHGSGTARIRVFHLANGTGV